MEPLEVLKFTLLGAFALVVLAPVVASAVAVAFVAACELLTEPAVWITGAAFALFSLLLL